MFQERQNLGAHCLVVRRFVLNPSHEIDRIAFDGRLEELANAVPLLGLHRASLLNSRKSHARARLQRRLSVAGDIPRALAASSMPNPAKYRSSTILAWSGSIWSSVRSASSPAGH